MATVTELASHLLTLLRPSPATGSSAPGGGSVGKPDAARLAFYHFLKNLCEPGEPLTTVVLERFFRRALGHAHWNQHKNELFAEVNACLQHFSNQHNEALPLPPFSSPADIQVLKAESLRTLERVLEDWLGRNQSPTDQVRMVKVGEDGFAVLRLALDRSFSVFLFDRWLALQEGRLTPLTDEIGLSYLPNLTLDPSFVQQIEVAPHTTARFRVAADENQKPTVYGLATRGFTFQKIGSFDGGDVHRHPMLFYPLKRIEQLFVNRQTDPLYTELTGLLEKASELVAQKHSEAIKFAEAALERGHLAFEHVFIDDRFLRLQLENLEHALKLERGFEKSTEKRAAADPTVVTPAKVGHKVGNGLNLGLNLNLPPGEEFVETYGPDLVELQEAEKCETIAPVNRPPAAAKAPQKI